MHLFIREQKLTASRDQCGTDPLSSVLAGTPACAGQLVSRRLK